MASLLRISPDYWQTHYLDERGQEQVRLDNLNRGQRPCWRGVGAIAEEYFTHVCLRLPPV